MNRSTLRYGLVVGLLAWAVIIWLTVLVVRLPSVNASVVRATIERGSHDAILRSNAPEGLIA